MKRVECDKCINFIKPVLTDNNNWLSTIKVRAKCKLKKRVMFRQPKNMNDENYGYFRYCNNFKHNK